MTQQDIKNKISALERGIKSPATPPSMKKQMETQLEKLRAQIGSSESSVSPAFEKGQKVHLKNVPEKTGTIGFERNGLWYVKFPDGSDGEFSASDLVVSGKSAPKKKPGTKNKSKAGSSEIRIDLKKSSAALIKQYGELNPDEPFQSLGRNRINRELKQRLKKRLSSADRTAILEHLSAADDLPWKGEDEFEVDVVHFRRLDQELTDIGIDMEEGSDESALAGLREELDDLGRKNLKNPEFVTELNKLVDDFEKDWLGDFEDEKAKKEIEDSIQKFRNRHKGKGAGKGTKKSAKADKPAAVPASLKEQSVSQLVSTWTSAEKKRGKGNVINEMQRRLKLKGTSEQDRKEIMEFLGVNGKARHKEKYILSDGRDVRDVPCSELVQMVVERRQAAIKSGKKSKAKPVMEKVTKHITLAVKESIEEIPADQIKKDPAKFKREMKALVRETKAYIAKLKKVLGKAFDASEIETMATEIEKLISEKAEKMGLGGVVLGFALGAGTMHVINKGKEAGKPDTTGKKFSYLPPVENFPEKIAFADDGKDIKSRKWYKWENGDWVEIDRKEYDHIYRQALDKDHAYSRKQKGMEDGKFVSYYGK